MRTVKRNGCNSRMEQLKQWNGTVKTTEQNGQNSQSEQQRQRWQSVKIAGALIKTLHLHRSALYTALDQGSAHGFALVLASVKPHVRIARIPYSSVGKIVLV